MTAKIEIRMDNAAFDGNATQELARILREEANRVERKHHSDLTSTSYPIRDINGNRVGFSSVD